MMIPFLSSHSFGTIITVLHVLRFQNISFYLCTVDVVHLAVVEDVESAVEEKFLRRHYIVNIIQR